MSRKIKIHIRGRWPISGDPDGRFHFLKIVEIDDDSFLNISANESIEVAVGDRKFELKKTNKQENFPEELNLTNNQRSNGFMSSIEGTVGHFVYAEKRPCDYTLKELHEALTEAEDWEEVEIPGKVLLKDLKTAPAA